jgi:hypothetical protein
MYALEAILYCHLYTFLAKDKISLLSTKDNVVALRRSQAAHFHPFRASGKNERIKKNNFSKLNIVEIYAEMLFIQNHHHHRHHECKIYTPESDNINLLRFCITLYRKETKRSFMQNAKRWK